MKKYKLFLIVLLFLVGCGTTKNISDYKYIDAIGSQRKARFELFFINDTICVFKHTFFCRDIDKKYQFIEQVCRYKLQDTVMIVKRINTIDNKDFWLERYTPNYIIDIPFLESKCCPFLNKKNRTIPPNVFYIGPSPKFDYDEFIRIPNFTTDTLQVHKDRIVFDKENKDDWRGILSVFKRNTFGLRLKVFFRNYTVEKMYPYRRYK